MNVGEINYYTHSSKTRCVFVDNKDLPLISIDIWCKAGSSFEEIDKKGSAHFLEHMIFKGSNKLKPGEFDHKIESLGGISNASTGFDDVHYHVLVPSINFKESLALLTNLVVSPKFKIEEFNKEKGVVIDEIKQQNDQIDEKLFNYFLKRVWGNSYYAKSILGTEKSVKILDIKDLEDFHKKHYVSEKICIAIAGNLTKNIFEAFEKSNLSGIYQLEGENKSIAIKETQPIKKQIARTGREEVIFKKLEFSRIFMAWNIPSLYDQKNIIGLEILAAMLSVGRNSRLIRILKEEKNIVESIYVDVNAGEFGGILIIEACCEIKNTIIVEEQINLLINQLIDFKDLCLNEIRKSINIVKSNYVFNLETSTQLSSFFGNELLWGRKDSINKFEEYLEYWSHLNNFKEIIQFINKEKFTLLAYPHR